MEDVFDLSEDLQRDIIALMINDRDFLIKCVDLVEEKYFCTFSFKSIIKIIKDYYSKYNKSLTVEILQQEISNNYKGDSKFPIIATEVDLIKERLDYVFYEKEYLYNAVIDFAKIQAMKFAILQSVDLLEKKEYAKIEELIRQALLVAPPLSLGTNFFNVQERYRKILNDIEGEKFSVVFPTLNKDLKGGICRKEVGTIFAPPSVGKSLFLTLVSIANMINDKNVLYISCEMSEERVAMRADAMSTFIPISSLVSSLPLLQERLKTLSENVKGRLHFKEFPSGEATINDIRSYTNQLYNYTGFKPDLIVLDYLDEVKCSNKNLDLYQGQTQVLRQFRAWMIEDNLAGITATQSNRDARQVKIATDAQIGDSYGKVRVTDYMWSLNETDEECAMNTMRLFVVKNRNGNKRYQIFLKKDPYTLRMDEITETQYDAIMGTKASKNKNIVSEESSATVLT